MCYRRSKVCNILENALINAQNLIYAILTLDIPTSKISTDISTEKSSICHGKQNSLSHPCLSKFGKEK